MAQRKLTLWFSKASSHQQAECIVSDSEAQDSLECTLSTKTQDDQGESDSSQSGSQPPSNSESESDDPTPPPSKVPRVVSRCSKSKTTVRYRTSKRGDYGARKDHTAKYSWLVPDSGGKGAFCKFCQKLYSGSRGLPKGSDGTFITKPFTKWRKATGSTAKNNKLLKHQQSKSHRQAVAEAEMCNEVEKRGSVFTQLHSASDREKSENLQMLSKYVKVAYWLMKHEIAHTTNYESLIDLCTDLDGSDCLAVWQSHRGENATYKSAATSTEMVKAIGQFLDEKTVQEVSSSPVLALMGDEATDLRNRTELSVCMRYLTSAGCTVECFLELVPVPDTTAETITNNIVSTLECRGIDLSKIVWIAFDGASNMSGHRSGVQTRLREEKCPEAVYVHCRSHLLQLACVYAAEKLKPIKQLFSALNSLWRLFSQSPKRTHVLREVQEVLHDPKLSLAQPGDTRWTSHYRAVRAVVKCLHSIVAALQHIHQDSGDLSSEAGGLLLTFQDRKMIVLLFAVKEVLNPVCKLALKLQHENGALCDIPDLLATVQSRFKEITESKEYLEDAAKYIRESGFALLDSSKMTDHEIHTKLVLPYIKVLSETINQRFNDLTTKMCYATSIFDPKKIKPDDSSYGTAEIVNLASLHSSLSLSDLQDEWKTFRNYVKVQAGKKPCLSGKDILQNLAAHGHDLADTFPQLSLVAKIILVCPLGTASVERSFSTMARVCNRLRQRILPENLAHCLRASIEGPSSLTTEQAECITKKWHSFNKSRRIRI